MSTRSFPEAAGANGQFLQVAGAAVVLLVIVSCSPPSAAPLASASTPRPSDMASYANTDAFVTRHLSLDLTADFDKKTLAGTAELRFERRDPGAH